MPFKIRPLHRLRKALRNIQHRSNNTKDSATLSTPLGCEPVALHSGNFRCSRTNFDRESRDPSQLGCSALDEAANNHNVEML